MVIVVDLLLGVLQEQVVAWVVHLQVVLHLVHHL
jgi:hypothetical protein